MPRGARKKSESGIYHIMVRGINKQNIFHDNDDRLHFLRILRQIKLKHPFMLLAFCLMDNHVHLLIKETNEAISQIMKRIENSYAFWYNAKYKRVGHVFQNRFNSEPVTTERYLLAVLRYIHQNPVKASMVEEPGDWTWSSHRDYLGESYPYVAIDKDLIQNLFGSEENIAIKNYREFISEQHDDKCMDEDENNKVSDEKLIKEIGKLLGEYPASTLQQMKKTERDQVIQQLKAYGGSVRQLAKLTGLDRNKIDRA